MVRRSQVGAVCVNCSKRLVRCVPDASRTSSMLIPEWVVSSGKRKSQWEGNKKLNSLNPVLSDIYLYVRVPPTGYRCKLGMSERCKVYISYEWGNVCRRAHVPHMAENQETDSFEHLFQAEIHLWRKQLFQDNQSSRMNETTIWRLWKWCRHKRAVCKGWWPLVGCW